MERLKSLKLTVTTNASGDGSATSTQTICGLLYAIEWSDGNFDDGVDLTLSVIETALNDTDSATVVTLTDANAGKYYYPRALVHDASGGTALTGTAGGDRAMPVICGRPKATIAQDGNAKTGSFIIYYFD